MALPRNIAALSSVVYDSFKALFYGPVLSNS